MSATPRRELINSSRIRGLEAGCSIVLYQNGCSDMLYQSPSAPLLRSVQRMVLAFMFLCVPAQLLYVWMCLPPHEWYSGAFSARFGLLISPGVRFALVQFALERAEEPSAHARY